VMPRLNVSRSETLVGDGHVELGLRASGGGRSTSPIRSHALLRPRMLLSNRMRRSPSPPPVSRTPKPSPARQREPFVATPSFVWGDLPENDPLVLLPHRRPTRNPPPIDNRPSFKTAVAPEPKVHQFYCPPTFRFVSKWPSDQKVELKQSHKTDADQLQMSEALMSSAASPLVKKMVQRGWIDRSAASGTRKPGVTAAQQQARLDAINRNATHLRHRVSKYLGTMDMDSLTYKLPAWARPPEQPTEGRLAEDKRLRTRGKKGARVVTPRHKSAHSPMGASAPSSTRASSHTPGRGNRR